MQNTTDKAKLNINSEEDALISQDFSVFRTRLPRPVSTMSHLILAALTFILALIAAIFYAEG